MFEGFTVSMIDTGEAIIRARYGGAGPPLLLLHGHPQTHVMWHRVAPRLAEHFTVVAPDLRGYGESSKPPTTADHEPYSKRAMARDGVEVMRQLGFEQFFVAGHDRGGRIRCPMLVLWSKSGEPEKWYDVLGVWRDWADDVRGRALDCGHYLAEEAPDATYAELRDFFTE